MKRSTLWSKGLCLVGIAGGLAWCTTRTADSQQQDLLAAYIQNIGPATDAPGVSDLVQTSKNPLLEAQRKKVALLQEQLKLEQDKLSGMEAKTRKKGDGPLPGPVLITSNGSWHYGLNRGKLDRLRTGDSFVVIRPIDGIVGGIKIIGFISVDELGDHDALTHGRDIRGISADDEAYLINRTDSVFSLEKMHIKREPKEKN